MKKSSDRSEPKSLFAWFNAKIAGSYAVSPAGHPADTLRELGAPAHLAETFTALMDCEIILKKAGEGEVPDLERREKKRKRSTGQFYTPESLAARLAELAGLSRPLDENALILDPACGDGSFLMAAAAMLSQFRLSQRHSRHSLLNSSTPLCHSRASLRHSRVSLCHSRVGGNLGNSCETPAAAGMTSILARLHGYDIDLQALFICLTRLICAFPGCGWPVLELRDFLMQPPEARFDLVIGNPPYRVNLSEDYKKRLDELYETGEGEKDLYTFFLEGGLKVLADAGQMVMLTSHTWLVNHQCRKIRQLLFEKNRVTSLNLLPARFFPAAPGVLPVVAFIEKVKEASPPYSVTVNSGYSGAAGWRETYAARSDSFLSGNGLRQSLVSSKLATAFAKMQASGVFLGKIAKIGVGIQESVQRTDRVSKFVSDSRQAEHYRPVLKGRELAPFKINWEGLFIDFGPHLAYAGDEKIWVAPKLLYQNIRNEKLKTRLVVAYDTESYYPKNSLSFIVSESADYPEMFLLGLLNSVPVNAWFSGRFHSFHVTVTQVRQIPLPPFNQKLFALVADCAGKLQKLSIDSPEYGEVFSRLNEAVCRCYGFGDEHSGLLCEFDNFLEQAAGL